MSSFAAIESLETTCKEPVNYLPEVVAITSEIVENRRWFHAHPELSFEEVKTAAKVVEILKSYGIVEIFEGIGKTGVVALIRGSAPGPCIALRADMDALPLQETADIEYRSQNQGVMHACGHDGHIAGLLAAAKILHAERDKIRGVVKLVFQPAEEGYGGAREMIKEGVLEEGPYGPAVDSIYGIHLWSCKWLYY
jgi:amidohydrolase